MVVMALMVGTLVPLYWNVNLCVVDVDAIVVRVETFGGLVLQLLMDTFGFCSVVLVDL